jgi:hypothetical protein
VKIRKSAVGRGAQAVRFNTANSSHRSFTVDQMIAFEDQPASISRRLKNALVADLAMTQLDAEGDRWLAEPLQSPSEWTKHFARQLGFPDGVLSECVHEVLLFVLQELDQLIRLWPPTTEGGVTSGIVAEATKHLSASEVLELIQAGPSRWSDSSEEGGKVRSLRQRLLPIARHGMVAQLHHVLLQWNTWDIPRLEQRRRDARDRLASERAAELERVRRERYGDRPERRRDPRPWYTPPGRS